MLVKITTVLWPVVVAGHLFSSLAFNGLSATFLGRNQGPFCQKVSFSRRRASRFPPFGQHDVDRASRNRRVVLHAEDENGSDPDHHWSVATGSSPQEELSSLQPAMLAGHDRGFSEWLDEWGATVKLNLFPIKITENSFDPLPLGIGFTDSIIVGSSHGAPDPADTFKKVLKLPERVFGICFYDEGSSSLSPVGVCARPLETGPHAGGGFEVRPLVVGRFHIKNVDQTEDSVVGEVEPMEDKAGMNDATSAFAMVDAIGRFHDENNEYDMIIMKRMARGAPLPPGLARPSFSEVFDAKMEIMGVSPTTTPQKFVQLASYIGFDFHLSHAERMQASFLLNTEDRVRFVRDALRARNKVISNVASAPDSRLTEEVRKLQQQTVGAIDAAKYGGPPKMGIGEAQTESSHSPYAPTPGFDPRGIDSFG